MTPRQPAPAPPSGYRPHLGLKVKLEAAVRQLRCPDCGRHLGSMSEVQADHSPALQLRTWDAVAGDTVPPANDPDFIVLRHISCHRAKTSGRVTRARAEGDVTEISRTNRLADEQAEFRRRILAKEPGKPRPKQSRIRSRGFRKGKRT